MGIAGSIRSAISTVWCAIFVSVRSQRLKPCVADIANFNCQVLTNRLKISVRDSVGPAAIKAGLPASSVPELLAAFNIRTPAAFDAVKGMTPNILAAAIRAWKVGSSQAYSTMFLMAMAVGGTMFVLALFAPSVDHLMNDKVVITLHKKAKEYDLGKKAQLG